VQAGLVGGEGFSIDASLIKAHADKKKQVPGDQPIAGPNAEETSRAVREYLVALDAARSDEESGGKADGGVARKGIDPVFRLRCKLSYRQQVLRHRRRPGTRANCTAEIAITETRVDRIKRRRFGLAPEARRRRVYGQSGC